MNEDREALLLLGRPFLATSKTNIDVDKGELWFKGFDNEVFFKIFETPQHFVKEEKCLKVDKLVTEHEGEIFPEKVFDEVSLELEKAPPPKSHSSIIKLPKKLKDKWSRVREKDKAPFGWSQEAKKRIKPYMWNNKSIVG